MAGMSCRPLISLDTLATTPGRAICALVVKDKIYRGNTCMRDTDGAMIVGILSPNKNEPGVRGQS